MGTHGQDLNATVSIVADPTSDAQHMGFTFYEPAKADTLNASANQEPASFDDFIGHRATATGARNLRFRY
jgi:hypothetical protein